MKKVFDENASITANSKQLEILKKHFPGCFDKNGAFNPEKLEEIVKASGVDIKKEGYSLNWLGKSYARLLGNQNITRLMAANTEHNEQPENKDSENLLIKGDNLEVLKHLKHAYYEKVKMIYIDPPYNTGGDGFVYQDDRKFTVDELSRLTGLDEEEAQRVLDFTDRGSNSHSAWLTFLYPRLYMARELLRDDGVIFVSIDDNEQAQLKLLMDDIFGEENFVGQIHWRRRHNQPNDKTKMLGLVAEHIIVYSKNNFALKQSGVGKLALTGGFSNPDNDPRGDWASKPWKAGSSQGGSEYKIISPTNVEFNEIWMGEEKTFYQLIADNRIFWTKGGNGFPRKKYFRNERELEGQCATNWWHHEQFGHNQEASNELAQIFGGKRNLFSNPKGIRLIKSLLQVSSTLNDFLILDFFAGSGTTAHAVMQLNAEDGGNRNYICVQLDEKTDKKSEAYKAGYESIFDITRERIKRAAAKIKQENPEATCDFGFKEFYTIPPFPHYLENYETMEEFRPFEARRLTHEERMQLMLTWQLYDGLPLHLDLTPIYFVCNRLQNNGYTAYQGEHIIYFMDNDLHLYHIIDFLERLDHDPDFAPRKLVILGGMLSSEAMREITENIKVYNNRKQIELTLDIRF